MDHRFSKRTYFVNCASVIFFSILITSCFFNISSCPFKYNLKNIIVSLLNNRTGRSRTGGAADGGGGGEDDRNLHFSLANYYYHHTEDYEAKREEDISSASYFSFLTFSSFFSSSLSCHMIDIIIWIYIISFIVFLVYKFLHFKRKYLHYFLLDFCYFHNLSFIIFLLYYLVSYETKYKERSSTVDELPSNYNFFPSILSFFMELPQRKLTLLSFDDLLLKLFFEDKEKTFLLFFFIFFSGSFGPILGGIVMWRNALLFHSLTHMSSIYLHFAPSLTQALILYKFMMIVKKEVFFFFFFQDQLHENSIFFPSSSTYSSSALHAERKRIQENLQEKVHRGDVTKKNVTNFVCDIHQFCPFFEEILSFHSLLKFHFFMFLSWQMYYVLSQALYFRRKTIYKKRLRKFLQKRKEEHGNKENNNKNKKNGSREDGEERESEDETKLNIILFHLSQGGFIKNPLYRTNAYHWLMEYPPFGKEGFLYKFVTMFGAGYLPSMILFQVMQWVVHVVFFTLFYGIFYYSLFVQFSIWPLVLYLCIFLLLTIYNAADINKKWIQKLQTNSRGE